MSQSYQLRQPSSVAQRKSSVLSVVLRNSEQLDNNNRTSSYINAQRQLSTVSQIYLPNGSEYQPQEHVPPTGQEGQQPFILATVDEDQTTGESIRLSVISQVRPRIDEENIDEYQGKKLSKITRRSLYFFEPIIGGFILFPILSLFWVCGWNLGLLSLDHFNKFHPNLSHNRTHENDSPLYSYSSLFYPYLITQFLLLIYYLSQNLIYKFLKKQNWFIKNLLLKIHIYFLAKLYIIQWVILWSIYDKFTPDEWYFELTLSLTSLQTLIVLIGHLSDLVCSPFIFSYDSIEYCIHFGCPLLTREMKQWKINLINYFLYEIIISNLSVIAWRGFYHLLDDYMFPNHLNMSIGICLLIGYLIYFPLMYFQTYLEELNLKYEFWTFVSINFPQFYRNIRHLLAFISCVFIWRGYWIMYDGYIYVFYDNYRTYLLFYITSFIILSIFQTASSMNGPLSYMKDRNNFFPLYPHCYVSIIQRKISKCFSSKSNTQQDDQNN